MIYIVMGVSSSGKTLIGAKLADRLQLPFFDADNFHPAANIRKMANGCSLDDGDRQPWLQKLKEKIINWHKDKGAVLACSALKESYREILSPADVPVQLIYLKGSKELIANRMKKRTNHFMPESLLDSQFAVLEEPAHAITVNINHNPDSIVNNILEKLNAT